MKGKRYISLWFFFIWLAFPLLSSADEQAQTLFEQGNAFYAKAQYEQAINNYLKLVNKGDSSATVYFNLGNTYYKTGDIASAILYYEKALKLSPEDQDINFNLKYVNLKTIDKTEEAPVFFLTRWWTSFMLSFSLDVLALCSVTLVLLGSACLVLYFFSGWVTLKKISFYAAIVLFLAGLLIVFIAGRQVIYFNDHRQAIIFSRSANVKNSPADQSATSFVIHNGTRIDILDSSNGWIKVKLANGNEGWIKQTDIKEI